MTPQFVTVGDFNGDGNLDLVALTMYPYAVSVLLGNGDGSVQPPLAFGVGINPAWVAVGDLNGDGKPDLAVANASSDAVSVMLNTCP
jgi:hypothetical protein